MKAPDKIYIHTRTEPYCSICSIIWSEVKEKNYTNEEYIRKDALLEWLEEKLKERHAPQFRDALGQVIDKINSL